MRDVLEMRWRDALFAHWRVDPATVAARLPPGLAVATHDGDAYLGVVGFEMADIRPRGVPAGLTFPELNLRTYVERDGEPGVYFFNLDADDRLSVAVARRLYRLPYYRAEMRLDRSGDAVTLVSRRVDEGASPAHFDATYRPTDEPATPEPGSLESFLVENYRFYTAADDGTLYAGAVAHEPWPLAPADCDLRANTLFEANGFADPDGEPTLHYSPGVSVTADRVRRVADPEPGSPPRPAGAD